ncbi:2OG-Fe(II) oxygenase [Sphingomonas sp. LB-2]|uniref:2OG-Fe(II) oxygenase n=1 Tax=Sphingomonas caeni TaxID=2984949 RepID=UPI002230DEF3|nr:2OG-Fe(II) oxygenase [Sphingomonas caeni]MCW3848211.1 2OG-Fe(II) oxygenase [Sphingomonas caeni]
MHWPPYFVLDLAAQELLPADWAEQVRAGAAGPERIMVVNPLTPSPEDGRFSILDGTAVRARFGWLWDLYHGPIRKFVAQSAGRPVFPANRISSAMTLNILTGAGAEQDWHTDATAMTGVFFATTMAEGEGGELEFRSADGEIAQLRPRAGVFACFSGRIEHRVTPLTTSIQRLSFPLLFYASAEDQPFASAHDRYELSAA